MDRKTTDQLQPRVLTTADARKQMLDSFMQPLSPILIKEGLTNIFIFSWDHIVYDDFQGRHEYEGNLFKSEGELLQLLSLAATDTTGKNFSIRNPVLHAVLPGGSRLSASMQPISENVRAAIRVFPEARLTLEDLANFGQFPHSLLPSLDDIVQDGYNVLFSGSTNAGKTTFMNAMLSLLPDNLDHVSLCEDVPELAVKTKLVTRLFSDHGVTRFDGRKCTLDTIIQDTLRNTPDRIIVGEIRDSDAAMSFFEALNTGHVGVWSTIHANTAKTSLMRVISLVMETKNMGYDTMLDALRESLHIAINIGFDSPMQAKVSGERLRRIQEVVRFDKGKDEVLYRYEPKPATGKKVIDLGVAPS